MELRAWKSAQSKRDAKGNADKRDEKKEGKIRRRSHKVEKLERHFLILRKTPGNSSEIRARRGGPRVVLAGRRMRLTSSRGGREAERPRPPSRRVARCDTAAGGCSPACGPPVSEGLACGANGKRGGADANVPIPTSYWKSRRQTHSAVSSRNLPHRNLWEERRTLPLLARAKKCAERFSPETDMPAVCKKRMASSLLRSAAARDSSEQYCSVIRYQEVLHGAHSRD
jgi:hypothetical protein